VLINKKKNMKELVAKINAEFEAFTAETESLIDKGVNAGARNVSQLL
jgi:hypothetical protein